jgi:predicted secreted protein
MALHGGKIIVGKKSGTSYVTAVAAAKSCEIESSCDSIPVSAPNISNGSWQHVIAGRKAWRVTVNALVSNVEQILVAGDDVELKIYNADVSSDYVTGDAIVSSCRVTGTLFNLAQMSVTFEGNGPLT